MNTLELQSTKNLIMHGTVLALWWHTVLQFFNSRQKQKHKNIGTKMICKSVEKCKYCYKAFDITKVANTSLT